MRLNTLLLLAFSLSACSSEIDNKPAADVQPVVETPPVVEAPAEVTGTPYKVDAATSKIEWVGAKVTKDHKGGFSKFEGTVLVNEGKAVGADFTIDLASVFSDDPKLTEHLNSPDFFETGKFTSATFTSRDIKVAEAPTTPPTDPNALVPTHTVTGDLDFHGVKKTLTFPAVITVGADKASTKAEFVLNRKDFGVVYPGKPDDLIKDEVLVKLDLSFPLVEAPAVETPAGNNTDGGPKVDPKAPGIPGGPKTVEHNGQGPAPSPGLKGGPGPKGGPNPDNHGKAVEGGSRK